MRITLADHDPAWARFFEVESAKIVSALGGRALLIEHVGSTSVPALPAKPVIDIVVAVADSAQEDDYAPALANAGYHVQIREPDWYEHRMLTDALRRVNLHVFSDGCPEIGRMLSFRDWLRACAADRELYARTKQDLAQRDWPAVQSYADAKTAVIQDIVTRASRSPEKA